MSGFTHIRDFDHQVNIIHHLIAFISAETDHCHPDDRFTLGPLLLKIHISFHHFKHFRSLNLYLHVLQLCQRVWTEYVSASFVL